MTHPLRVPVPAPTPGTVGAEIAFVAGLNGRPWQGPRDSDREERREFRCWEYGVWVKEGRVKR